MAWRRPPAGLGTLLLAIWLIAWGFLSTGWVHFQGSGSVVAIFAIVVGVVLLWERS